MNVSFSAAIGNFDGVHIGHQEVINEAVRVSNKNKVGVLTFEPSILIHLSFFNGTKKELLMNLIKKKF